METGKRNRLEAGRASGARATPYVPPTLTVVGSVYELTLTGGGNKCWFGKKWGGSDGLEYMNMAIPVSSC